MSVDVTPQWRLARVEVVNWGTFVGRTVIDVARAGHLITGPSGSGKSSLLDAIATVLTPRGSLRFNAAAQDASTRNDDRSLVSYVRGAWSRESDAEQHRAVARFLRPGPTWSGVALRFDDGEGGSVSLLRLFQLRGRSVDAADLKDVSFADRGTVTIEDVERFVTPTIDVRAIKKVWPSATVGSGAGGGYFGRIERLLGPSTTALQLLHRTQSAKNLGTLDQLFRGFMLEEPTTFALADNAVQQFGELHAAHRLVVEAREQRDALRSLEPAIVEFEAADADAVGSAELLADLPAFQDALLLRLTENDLIAARTEAIRTADGLRGAEQRRADAGAELGIAGRAARDLGGDRTELARTRLDAARRAAADVERARADFGTDLRTVGIEPPATASAFAEFVETARTEVAGGSAVPVAAELHRAAFEARDASRQLTDEIETLQRQRSNLPAGLLRVRNELADALGISTSSLPFVGELVDVNAEHARWTGAFERVLRPLATSLAVRSDVMPQVRRSVERQHLGVRLVFESVPPVSAPPRPARSGRSLLHRIRVAPGAFHDWALWRLGEEYDYECVDSADELGDVERGLTVHGQARRGNRYEKNDRDRIDDRRKWVLGSDVTAKLELLVERLADADAARQEAEAVLDRAGRERDFAIRRTKTLEVVLRRHWDELDIDAAAARVARAASDLELLSHGNVDLERALADEARARQDLDTAERDEREASLAAARAVDTVSALETSSADLRDRLGDGILRPDRSDELDQRFRLEQRSIGREQVYQVGGRVQAKLHRLRDEAQGRARSAEHTFLTGALHFRSRWPALVADLTDHISDRTGFRGLRAEIESRGLPAHEQRFLRLLRERSRELIGHLLSDLRDAVKVIRERIDPVNVSLRSSEYDRDRFLHIRVRDNRSPEVQQFLAQLRSIVDGSWADEEIADAEERFAVLEEIMVKLGSSERSNVDWRRRCLDTREHVTFQAAELDRDGVERNVHDSGAGLSGGQRQKLVIFCLAAALRYQLTDEEDGIPAYGTIILDEAFDKADVSYTRNAMNVFVTFGFHMVLATPQKLLSTIEPYVGAVTAVANDNKDRSTIANIRWETDAPDSARSA